MASIKQAIELEDKFTRTIDNIINSVNLVISAMGKAQESVDGAFDPAMVTAAKNAIDDATMAAQQMAEIVERTRSPIDENTKHQRKFNHELQAGGGYASGLVGKIKGAIGAYLSIAGIKQAFSYAQNCMSAFDTQLNAEIQLAGVLSNTLGSAVSDIGGAANVDIVADTSPVEAAFDTITAKASEIQANGIYGDEAMIAAGAEFSTYFTDTGAIEMMMDTLSDYAMGMSGGGAIDSTAMVDYATGLGKIMTGSYEAMTKKGFEFTEAQKAIIEGTASQAQIVEAIGEEYVGMSQDMQAAAAISSVISESWDGLYEKMSNTPQGKIQQLTNKWGDLEEMIGNRLYPHVIRLVDFVNENWETIEGIISAISEGVGWLIDGVGWLAEQALMFAQVIIDNWSSIAPVVSMIAGAVALLVAVIVAYKVATTAASVAQGIMNGALYACPIVWIIAAVMLLIVIIYKVVEAVNKATGATNSALGIIMGSLAAAGAIIINIVIGLVNAILQYIYHFIEPFISIIEWVLNVANGGFDSFGDAVANLIGNIISWFLSLGKVVTTIIDAIFGTDWTSGLTSLQNDVLQWGKNENAITLSREAPQIDYHMDYYDAYSAGYQFGEGIDNMLSSFDPNSILDQNNFMPDGMGGIGDTLSDIAGDTGDIKNSLDISQEDLKYLRDIAEQETINRFTTAEIHIDMSGMTNTVNSGSDLDGFISELTDEVTEAMFISAEGVHA